MSKKSDELTNLIHASDHAAILRYIRAHKLREPDLVLAQAEYLLPKIENEGSGTNIMDEPERLAALEQICVAALDGCKFQMAEDALGKIKVAVGKDSVRYRVLLGLCLESQDDFETANQVYDDLLVENPSNVQVLKRKYCILKAQQLSNAATAGEEKTGSSSTIALEKKIGARAALNDYLERNGSDSGAWVEMSNTCLEQGDYAGAAYSYEEVALTSPLNSEVHCKLGELYATAGGKDNLKLARKHIAQSLELDPKNLRAMYALVSTTEAYMEEVEDETGKKKKKGSIIDEDDEDICKGLLKYGKDKLSSSYKGTRLSGTVEKAIM